ncbi:MAG: ATP-binding protein, partial [Acidobacteria bacterium]|nr:ATP-binding protein [Acidobacteriota bacterium]
MPTSTVHTIKPNDRLGARFRSASQGGSVAVALVGCVVLLGWMLDVTPLKSLGQGALVVKANTAVGFLLAGASLWLTLSPRTGRHGNRLALAGAVLVALIGLATLSQDLSGWDLGIDQLLFTEIEGAPGTASPGRMAPNTALMFVLIGLGLSLLNQTTIRGPGPCQILTLGAGAIALSGVLGHAFGESGFYGLPHFSSMALTTALTTVVLCLSILFARPASGLMAFVTDRGAVGVLVRRLLPVAFLVPPAFGWLGLWGERNALYTSAFGAVLVAVANMAALAFIAWATVRALTREHQERARVAAALVKSERLQHAIFNSVNFSSIATDAKGVIQLFNVGAERMLGYTAAEVVNTITPAEMSDPQELVARARTLSLELGRPIAPGFEALAFKAARGIEDIYELTYIRKGGGRIPAVVSVTALRDDQDAIIGYLLIGTDNTARKQVDDERLKLEQQLQQKYTELEEAGRTLEAQFRQANKMDAIGQLAAGVAHDFNNLLTVILGFSELITADASLSRHHQRDLQEITQAARRASGLTKQLLAFSRQQALSAVPLDVNALVTDMSGMLGRLIGEDITITLALAPALPLVLADRGQLEQVVMNLVVNARDAMPGGGRVTIRTASVALESSVLDEDTIAAGTYVRLSITDTGIGMSPDTQAHLFEPFFTTKGVGKGTGLGLSTVA